MIWLDSLGVVRSGEGKGFVVADIPGLIEGASEGLGLGHEFLRHVDRCRLLLHVVDVSGLEGRDPITDIETINAELARYDEGLASRPQIIVANKSDMIESGTTDIEAFEQYVRDSGRKLVYISALNGENLDELVRVTAEALETLPPLTVYEAEYTEEDSAVPAGERETVVRRENDTYYVEGEWLYNLMGQVNTEDYESLSFFSRVLQKAGVIDMLEAKGCKDGDTVNIYDFEFDFVK